jgi:hypothetical protein
MRRPTTRPPAPSASTGPRAPNNAKARQTLPNHAITQNAQNEPTAPAALLTPPSRILQNEPTNIPTPSWTSPQIVGAPNEGHNGR